MDETPINLEMMRRVMNYAMDEVRRRALDEAAAIVRKWCFDPNVKAETGPHLAIREIKEVKSTTIYSWVDADDYASACSTWFEGNPNG